MSIADEHAGAGGDLQWKKIATFLRNNASIALIYGIIIVLAITAAIFTQRFQNPANLINILRQSIVIGLIAIGQSVVILTGGADMSVAMVARIVALIVATVFAATNSNNDLILPLILLGVVVGALLGCFNGVLITRTHANPFIITFGVANILRGINLAIATTPIMGIPSEFLKIYSMKLGIVPVNVLVIAVVWLLAWLFTTRAKPGRALFAVGGSEKVARLSGIRVNRTLVMAYVFSGVCAALAGLFLLSRTGVGDPSAAEGMDFQSIVAVALGGISLYGGKGSMIGTLGGVLLLSLLSNVFDLTQVNIYYQQLLLGMIVLIAVAAYKSPRSA
ncbi:MAG: ABC transporter permease [Anaerolineaceae bacterium]|nr:ABC transporter permease [Anaerolineaceae bacterium]